MNQGVAQTANGSDSITLGWVRPQFLTKITDVDVQTAIQRRLVAEQTFLVECAFHSGVLLPTIVIEFSPNYCAQKVALLSLKKFTSQILFNIMNLTVSFWNPITKKVAKDLNGALLAT